MNLKQYGLYLVTGRRYQVDTKTVPAGAIVHFCEGCENVGIKTAGIEAVLDASGGAVLTCPYPVTINMSAGQYFYKIGNADQFTLMQLPKQSVPADGDCVVVLSGVVNRGADALAAGSIIIGWTKEHKAGAGASLLTLKKLQ